MNNLITNLLHGVLPHRDNADGKAADAPAESAAGTTAGTAADSAADFQDVGVEDSHRDASVSGIAVASAATDGAGAAVLGTSDGGSDTPAAYDTGAGIAASDDADTAAAAADSDADATTDRAPAGRHRADTTPDEVRTGGVRPATHSSPHPMTTHATIAGDSALTSVGEYRKQRGELDTTPEHEHEHS